MRILVIGGTGFIGVRVVHRLCASGHEVVVLHRGEHRAELPAGTRELLGDRDALPERRDEFAHLAPQVVLDVVPFTAAQAQALVWTFAGIAARLVVISSGDVYRNADGLRGLSDHPPDPAPLCEDAPLRQRLYPYRGVAGVMFRYRDDYEKILVERTVTGVAALPATVLRLPLVYGPGDYQRRLWPWLHRMRERRPHIVLGQRQAAWQWSHGYVENVAAAVALAAVDARAAGRVYNVAETPTPTEAERVHELGAAAGWSGRVVTVAEERLPQPLRTPLDYRYPLAMDSSRIRRELGYCEPVPREEALRQTVAWEWAHPPPDGGAPPDYAAEDAVAAD